ncbi:MAG: flagellar hook assembly protein FlgD [Novosphingobium sp.]
MTVSAISGASAPQTNNPVQTLGQRDFIKLMTTQMKLQDPTDPVDNKEMIAQMAQFSSLSGIENINSTLKAISAQLDQVLADKAATPTA